jgi:hypothetical protein
VDTLNEIDRMSQTQSIPGVQPLLNDMRSVADKLNQHWNIFLADLMCALHNVKSVEDIPQSRTDPQPESRNLDVTGDLVPVKPKREPEEPTT